MSDPHGVGMPHEDDGNRSGRPPGGLDLGRRGREDDIDLHAGQLGGRFVHLLDRARPSELDDQVLAFDIAQFAQACSQHLDSGPRGRVAEAQESETRALGLLLRARKPRPREPCRSGKRDQLATPHARRACRQSFLLRSAQLLNRQTRIADAPRVMTNHAHHDADFSHAPEPTQLDIQTGVSRRRERVQPL